MKFHLPILLLPLAIALACSPTEAPVAAPAAGAFEHSHSALGKILGTYVKDGMVDYASLKKNRAGLDGYLGETAAVSKKDFDGWTEDQQLAFLINVYNAETLQLIIDNYPVKSIKKIGSLFGTPWDVKSVQLFGKITTLNAVEHDILRKDYQEPRIHFAIVCAANGCPPLRSEAFVADQLDAQLEDQAKVFLGQKEKNRVDGGTLYLSSIFDWFEGDFTTGKAKTVAEYVNPWFSEDVSGKKVKHTDYDWDLNKQ